MEYLRALIAAGFKHIDAASFVSPRAVPQMADSETVISELDPPDDVEIIGIVVNERGAERAISTDAVRTLGFPYSLSPTFLKNNQNQTLEENLDILEKIKQKADESGLDTIAYISMAFGNPYGDLWNADELIEGIGLLADMDLQAISLADTVGAVDAASRSATCSARCWKNSKELRSACICIAVQMTQPLRSWPLTMPDLRRFDSAIGGMGGCPFAQDVLVGNIPTEKLLEAFRGRGVDVPLNKPITEPFRMAVRNCKQVQRTEDVKKKKKLATLVTSSGL